MKTTTRNSMPRVRMLIVSTVALVAALGLAAAPACAGLIGIQATGGWYSEYEEEFVGAGLRFSLGNITIIPNGEYFFLDEGNLYSAYLDGTLSLLPLGVASIYGGGGVGWLFTDFEEFDTDTDTVFDLLAGAGFNAVPLKPFAQLKWVFADGDDPIVYSIGIRF